MKTVTKIINTKQKDGSWVSTGLTENIINYSGVSIQSSNKFPTGIGMTYEEALINMINDAKSKKFRFNYDDVTEIVPQLS